MAIPNPYEDAKRAEAYARLEFHGTYYLAYRDLPAIISEHVKGNRALDFGCGTGRSTRFLRGLGFEVTGIDTAADMLARARESDPSGDYRLIEDGNLGRFGVGAYDLVLSAFTFDSIPTLEEKVGTLTQLRDLLQDSGRIVNLVSTPEIYVNEWTSFSTRDFPENRQAGSGDRVKIVITDILDDRPVEDFVATEAGYRDSFRRAGLEPLAIRKPLASGSEPYAWVNETRIAPWAIHVLRKI